MRQVLKLLHMVADLKWQNKTLCIFSLKVYGRNLYIFKHWTSQSSCAQCITVWAPLVVQNTSR